MLQLITCRCWIYYSAYELGCFEGGTGSGHDFCTDVLCRDKFYGYEDDAMGGVVTFYADVFMAFGWDAINGDLYGASVLNRDCSECDFVVWKDLIAYTSH